MSHKTRIRAEEKARIVEDCIAGKLSRAEAARKAGVDKKSLRRWITRYEAEGSLGFMATGKNRIYSEETKLAAVRDYLSGSGSAQAICKKYKICSERQLWNWIQVYNSGRDFKHKMSGGSRMKNTRKTTLEERVQIARECIENGNNYGEIAVKYQVSYQNVYSWVKKYKELGEAGLEDRRG